MPHPIIPCAVGWKDISLPSRKTCQTKCIGSDFFFFFFYTSNATKIVKGFECFEIIVTIDNIDILSAS